MPSKTTPGHQRSTPAGEADFSTLPVPLRRWCETLIAISNSRDEPERERYKAALMAAANILRELGAPLSAAKIYFNLAVILQDLDAGKGNPVLEPKKPTGGPPETTKVWVGRSRVCLSVAALMASGMRQDEAVEYVVKHIGPAIRKLRTRSKKGAPARAVLDWYDAFSANYVTNEYAQHNFNHHKALLPERIIGNAEERLAAAKRYMAGGSDLIAADFPDQEELSN